MQWQSAAPYNAGDIVTAMVPRRDLWSRLLRIFGIVRLERATFRCTESRTSD